MSKTTPLTDLPAEWQTTIRELRRENQVIRKQRNDAREALAALSLQVTHRPEGIPTLSQTYAAVRGNA